MMINSNTCGNILQKYNMFVAQIGCAAFGVLALSLFGPGWLARSAALSACIAFMTITGASHPPGKSPKINIFVWLSCPQMSVLHLLFTELLFCSAADHFWILAAASLPLLFIDGAKFHNLQLWYALFPGAAGCLVLCLIVSKLDITAFLKNIRLTHRKYNINPHATIFCSKRWWFTWRRTSSFDSSSMTLWILVPVIPLAIQSCIINCIACICEEVEKMKVSCFSSCLKKKEGFLR